MGRGLGRGLGTNAQVTTPGGLGFQRGPFGVGFSPGVGRGYPHDMAEPHWPRALAMAEPHYDVASPRHPSHAPPYPFEIGFWSWVPHTPRIAPCPQPTSHHTHGLKYSTNLYF
ncbi:hypothetical protein Hanom_Chr05g00420111 [Helianthus anomalus]